MELSSVFCNTITGGDKPEAGELFDRNGVEWFKEQMCGEARIWAVVSTPSERLKIGRYLPTTWQMLILKGGLSKISP